MSGRATGAVSLRNLDDCWCTQPIAIVVDFHILVNWAGRSGGEHAASRGGGASLADWSGCCAGFGAGTSNDGNDSGGFGDGGRS